MKKKDILDDLEIYIDPKPLTKEEEIGLSLFIKQLKDRNTLHPTTINQNLSRNHSSINNITTISPSL